MELLLVGLGGALGSIVRYRIGGAIGKRISGSNPAFPVGTFAINISGALFLGFLCGLPIRGNLFVLFGDGFLGAYTTFSTFMYEGFALFRGDKRLNAALYILVSLVLGVCGYAAGFFLGSRI